MTKKLAAEFIGTFTLVLFGCGAVVLAGFGIVGQLGIAFAFGLSIVAMAYAIGPISGCHVNPAVSFGAWIAKRMSVTDMAWYWLAQCLGAIVGAGVLYLIASGAPGYEITRNGLGQDGFGLNGSPGDYGILSCFVFEVVATFIFLLAILGVTQKGSPTILAGLVIGLTLTVIHIVGIQVTGVSVNPARSLGPAVFVGGKALEQLWLFVVAPLIGAGLAGLTFRVKLFDAEEA